MKMYFDPKKYRNPGLIDKHYSSVPVHTKKKNKKITREEIELATKEYLENGGTITKLDYYEESYEDFIKGRSSFEEIDDFLRN